MSRLTVIACALVACGCHESLGLVGDARSEPGFDVAVDALVDTAVDRRADPAPEGPCPPRSHDEMHIDFFFDDYRYTHHYLYLSCSTEDFREDPVTGTLHIWLDCTTSEGTSEEHHLFVRTDPHVPIDASLFFGDDLVVRYIGDPVLWVNRWLTIHRIGYGLVLGAVSAETIEPRVYDEWYSPLNSWRVGGRCLPEEGWCGTFEREAIEVEELGYEGTSVVIFDGESQHFDTREWGQYHVMVSQAHHYRFLACEDMPVDWINALFIRLP